MSQKFNIKTKVKQKNDENENELFTEDVLRNKNLYYDYKKAKLKKNLSYKTIKENEFMEYIQKLKIISEKR